MNDDETPDVGREEPSMWGENRPIEALDWLEEIKIARQWAENELKPGIDKAIFGSTMITAHALIPYRGLNHPVLKDWAFSELAPYFSEKGATPKDRVKAVFKMILNQLSEAQARGVMELSTWSYSTVLYLDYLLNEGLWVPDPYPLDVPQVVEKIDAIGGIFKGKEEWDKLLGAETRRKNAEDDARKKEIERLKALELNKPLNIYRREVKQQKKAEEQGKRAPVVAGLLRRIGERSTPLTSLQAPPIIDSGCSIGVGDATGDTTGEGTTSPAPVSTDPTWDTATELAFRIPGTHEWRLFDDDLRSYLLDCLIVK